MFLRKTIVILSLLTLHFCSYDAWSETSDGVNFEEIYEAAKQGDAEAQFKAGEIFYHFPSDTPDSKHLEHAIYWFELSARQGHARAQLLYGLMLNSGQGADQDSAVGASWIKLSAEQGDVLAQYQLGSMYFKGEGVEQSDTQSLHWWQLSAEQGHEEAISSLDSLLKLHELRANPPQRISISKWNEKAPDMAISVDTDDEIALTASVSYSEGGDKRIYFSIHRWNLSKKADICDANSSGNQVWEFNTQAVLMSTFCESGVDGQLSLSATPKSEKGEKFVIDLFKRSVKNIVVDAGSIELPISPIGFTSAWNSKSRDVY